MVFFLPFKDYNGYCLQKANSLSSAIYSISLFYKYLIVTVLQLHKEPMNDLLQQFLMFLFIVLLIFFYIGSDSPLKK